MIPRALRGLRGRLLLALVATSAVTLVVAAAITLSPLRERLRTQSRENLATSVARETDAFEKAMSGLLTALDSEADAVQGLEAGADDYVTKPFGLAELRSRIRAVLRRAGTRAMGDEVLVVGPIVLDRAQREVMMDGRPVRLTFSEFELLDALMADPGRLLNRQELLRAIWGDSAYRDPRAIDVHIRHLREKLEPEADKPRYILTVRGAGYRLRGP